MLILNLIENKLGRLISIYIMWPYLYGMNLYPQKRSQCDIWSVGLEISNFPILNLVFCCCLSGLPTGQAHQRASSKGSGSLFSQSSQEPGEKMAPTPNCQQLVRSVEQSFCIWFGGGAIIIIRPGTEWWAWAASGQSSPTSNSPPPSGTAATAAAARKRSESS